MKNIYSSALVILLLSSCATMKSGKTQDIKVDSTPSGADCTLTNGTSSVTVRTPAVATVNRSMSTLKVACQAQGFGNGSSDVKYGANWWTAANIANFGVGYIYDTYTGAVAQYPSEVNVVLKPVGQIYNGNFQLRDYNSNAVVPNNIPQPQPVDGAADNSGLTPYQQYQMQKQYQQQGMDQGSEQPQYQQQPEPQYQQQPQQYQQNQPQQPQSQEQLMQEMMRERQQITGRPQQQQ